MTGAAPLPDWYKHALCAGHGEPDLWFPDGPDSTEQADRAKAVCAACPVRDLCLAHAMENEERHGIWGGTTGRERRRIFRQRNRSIA